MSIYDVDYNKLGQQNTPPDKRGPLMLALIGAFLASMQWVRNLWMGSYRTGTEAQPWVAGTYAKYYRVVYKQRVYESLKDGNTDVPTLQTSWMLVQENFIGVFERVLYNGTKLTFEYGINKFFGTVFRQPPNVSDIYITVEPKPKDVFVIGGSEINSSAVFRASSTGNVIDAYSFGTYFNMTIHVPAATFNSLDAVPANCEKIIRNFADKYIFAGIIYAVTPY